MPGRGGDLRPSSPPEGRDLHYAHLLFQALWDDTSAAGDRFHSEREALYQHWRRLLKAIIAYKPSSPLAGIEETIHFLDNLERDHRNHEYPKPRPLTPEEHACWKWRKSIAESASMDIHVNLEPLNQPGDFDGTQESWATWEEASRYLLRWGDAPAYDANPDRKLKRWVRRPMVIKYRNAVAAFCEHWRLKAWWAAPALIHDHFLRAELEDTWDPAMPPLSMYVFDPGFPVSSFVAVKLPGRTQEEYERDRVRSKDHKETSIQKAAGGPVRVVRQHFSREERAAWERAVDSSCVTLEWNGRKYLSQSLNSDQLVTPAKYLLAQCEDRLDRSLLYREKRDIRGQVFGQVREYRLKLEGIGWSPRGHGDLNRVASWAAARILQPDAEWDTIVSDEDFKSWDSSYLRQACTRFAKRAGLTLPALPPGRPRLNRCP